MMTAATKPLTDSYILRAIHPEDNEAIAVVIRAVLTEFGCTGPGFAIHDPELDAMHDTYTQPRSQYYVVQVEGKIVGGGGVAPLAGTNEQICELQKFYILPEYRGLGFGKLILEQCLIFAREHEFNRCYIETVEAMHAAEALYNKAGFVSIPMPLGNTGHFACDRWYVRIL